MKTLLAEYKILDLDTGRYVKTEGNRFSSYQDADYWLHYFAEEPESYCVVMIDADGTEQFNRHLIDPDFDAA